MTPEQAVNRWVPSVLGRPFAWGETDCASLTLQALSRLTGTDHAAAYAGAWRDEAQALAHFATELPSAVLQRLGAREVLPACRVFGDVLTVPAPPWPEQVHFVLGRFCLASAFERGVQLLPARFFAAVPGARAWRLMTCLKPYP